MSTSNNDLNQPKKKDPITTRIARGIVNALTGGGTPKAPAATPPKTEPQPQAEATQATSSPKVEDDKPSFVGQAMRPFIPNPLGNG